MMKRLDKRKLLGDFEKLRNSIKKKFSETEIMEEIKKNRKNNS